jgi:taurine dioxygenase
MKATPLTPHIGADIVGVDAARIDDATFAALHAAWLAHGVLRLRGQHLDDDALQRFSARFGRLEEVPMGRATAEERAKLRNRYITVISNIVENGRPIGGLGDKEANWHSDMSYNEVTPSASVLYAVELPAQGGDTHFACQEAALAALPAGLRARLDGLRIKHDAAHTSVGDLRRGFEAFVDPRDAPGAVHPAVRVHPETGRPVLFLGRREFASIPGMALDDSEALLDELWQYAAQPAWTWTQQWQLGDLVIWDNRRVLHRRDGFDPHARRLLRRCQVLG